ncbi:hypothetical protein PtA15_10A462 [Puccinia triticina]|uniref:RRM domain-containing protein n=1 Tax=Puccinia triticina TaxID=208348 RepID=A0ABY7CUQ4_9BASI|nr:uncharacterized protein PtA15_10A462 [Puccinia triticina]WAQ89039.1 hypothetical protein PtA15_10A462 [Puccinia triticina]
MGLNPSSIILLQDLHPDTTAQKITNFFQALDEPTHTITTKPIQKIVFIRDCGTKASRGLAFVQFKDNADALNKTKVINVTEWENVEVWKTIDGIPFANGLALKPCRSTRR